MNYNTFTYYSNIDGAFRTFTTPYYVTWCPQPSSCFLDLTIPHDGYIYNQDGSYTSPPELISNPYQIILDAIDYTTIIQAIIFIASLLVFTYLAYKFLKILIATLNRS